MEDVIKQIIENPENFSVVVDECEVTAYDKSNGDTHKFDGMPEDVLVELLTAMGCETERV